MLVDEPGSSRRYEIRRVTRTLDRLVVFPKIRLPCTVVMRVVIVVAALQSEKLVEAMCARALVLDVTKMPFTHQRGRIPVVLEKLRQRVPRGREAAVVCPLGVRQRGFDPVPLLVAPGNQGRTRRRTGNAVRIEVREPQTLARKSVEIRGTNVRCAIAAQIGPTHIVRDDEHDVRLRAASRLREADTR